MISQQCPSCSNQSFKIITARPFESSYKILLVQCSSCKHVVATLCNDAREKLIQTGSTLTDQREKPAQPD